MKKGYSLVELILTVVILAVAVSGSLTILGGMTRYGTDAEKQTLAIAYARMRMDQILSKKFHESMILGPANFPNCTNLAGALEPETDETPTGAPPNNNYDDVDDFNGFSGEITTDPLYGKGLKTNVQVDYVTPTPEPVTGSVTGTLNVSSPSTCYKRITVQVVDTHTNQVLLTVRTLVTPYK